MLPQPLAVARTGSRVLCISHGQCIAGSARLLVLVMVVPAFGPLAMARISQQSGAHCLRQPGSRQPAQSTMQCHRGMTMAADGADPQSSETSVSAIDSCCPNHACCRGMATPQWAQPQSQVVLRSWSARRERIVHRRLASRAFRFSSIAIPPALRLAPNSLHDLRRGLQTSHASVHLSRVSVA